MPLFNEIAKYICAFKSYEDPTFIGNGAFKEVYSSNTSENIPIALKVFDPNKCDIARANREIAAMQQCNSPFIGKVYDWGMFKDAAKKTYLFVTEEYICGGTLADRIGSTNHEVIKICDYGITLLTAISNLRDNALVHRDIKPDNIMFRTGSDEPVLVDFGLVRDLSGVSLTQTFLPQGPGTPFFASPEQLNNDKFLIDWRSDQFSIGVVLSICLTGSHPYKQPRQTKIQTVGQVISRAACSYEFSDEVSKVNCEFLVKMVSPWPIDRFAQPDLIISKMQELKQEISA